MTPLLVEAATALRRMTRRRVVLAVGALDLALLLYTAVMDPVDSARAAFSAATALAALTVVVLSAGIVADDRGAGRLAVASAHPARRADWVMGRWLAVAGPAAAVATLAAGTLLATVPARPGAVAVALGWAAATAYLAALAGLAVALSCTVGSTPQIFALLAVLVLGAVPPDVVVHAIESAWIRGLARGVWTLLPTPWTLGRLHDWSLAGGPPAPAAAASLAVQAAGWLVVGARTLTRAELATRSA
jgi:hypothetical protein